MGFLVFFSLSLLFCMLSCSLICFGICRWFRCRFRGGSTTKNKRVFFGTKKKKHAHIFKHLCACKNWTIIIPWNTRIKWISSRLEREISCDATTDRIWESEKLLCIQTSYTENGFKKFLKCKAIKLYRAIDRVQYIWPLLFCHTYTRHENDDNGCLSTFNTVFDLPVMCTMHSGSLIPPRIWDILAFGFRCRLEQYLCFKKLYDFSQSTALTKYLCGKTSLELKSAVFTVWMKLDDLMSITKLFDLKCQIVSALSATTHETHSIPIALFKLFLYFNVCISS